MSSLCEHKAATCRWWTAQAVTIWRAEVTAPKLLDRKRQLQQEQPHSNLQAQLGISHCHAVFSTMECVLLSRCPAMAAQQWDDIMTQAMPSSHSTQREGLEAGGTTCRAAPTLLPPEVVGAYQEKAAAVEDTWMKKNRICILTLGAAWLNSMKNLVYDPYKASHILG